MKTLLVILTLLLSACAPYETGNYRIVTSKGDIFEASAILVVDEEEKIKYKDQSGTHTYQGSFELYEFGEE